MDDSNKNYDPYQNMPGENGDGAYHAQEEDIDSFINRLRDTSTLQDMMPDQMGFSRQENFSQSEAVREPVPAGSDAELVLGTAAEMQDGVAADKPKTGKAGSKKSTRKHGKKLKDKQKDPSGKESGWMRLLRVAVYGLCGLAVVFCVVVIVAAMYLSKVTVNDDVLLDLNSVRLGQSTRIMGKDPDSGDWMEVARIFGEENRVWIPYNEIPKVLIAATVASEDGGFWTHRGVDIKRTIGAFINEYVIPIWPSTQGGSTITQQLIKNLTDEDESEGGAGALRKLREIYRAFQLERRFSKEQILEVYLNTIRLSGRVAGIEAGANYYFGKTTAELTAAESAAIVCITKLPGANNPFVHPDTNKSAREYVLYRMNELGYFSGESAYRTAVAESDGFVFTTPGVMSGEEGEVYSYATDLLIEVVGDDLAEEFGITAAEAEDMLFNDGLVIYSTIDPRIQEVVERVALDAPDEDGDTVFPDIQYIETESQLAEELTYPGAPADLAIGDARVNQIQGGMVVMDYEGRILGVAGGLREKEVSRGTNRAMTPRQVGSAMKPLSIYGPGIEFNTIHYSSWFPDAPAEVVNGRPWPDNFSNLYGGYGAGVTVYDGIRVSLNTTAVFALLTLGVDISYDFLRTNLGITTLADGEETDASGKAITDRALAPLATGSLSYGISAIEMAAGYAVFGNGGRYTEPHCYTLVTDTSGATVLLDKESTLIRVQAISPETSYIMNQLLQGVMYRGTTTAGVPSGSSMRYAGKSGTTNENKEIWMCGMNPYYVCVTWMGYDFSKYYRWITRPTQTAFRMIMDEISAELPTITFPSMPSGVTTLTYCEQTGYIATAACPLQRTGYYKDGNQPTIVCDHALALPDPYPDA